MVQDSPQTSSALTQFVINKVQQDDLGKFTSVIGGRISNDNADGNFLSILQVLNMLEEFPSLTMGMSFHKEGECRSIPAKPTCIKKEKDIPRLPEI